MIWCITHVMLIGISGLPNSGRNTVADILVSNFRFAKVSFLDPVRRFAQEIYHFTDEQLWGPYEVRNTPDKRYPRGWKLSCGCVCDRWHKYNPPRGGFLVENIIDTCETHPDQWWKSRILFPSENGGTEPQQEYLTPELAVQLLETEWGRKCYPNTWNDYAIRIYNRLQKGNVYYERTMGLRAFSGFGDVIQPKINVVIPDLRFLDEVESLQRVGGIILRITRPEEINSPPRSKTRQEIPTCKIEKVLENTGTIQKLTKKIERFVDAQMKELSKY